VTRDDDIMEALRPTFAREATAIAERLEQATESGRRDDVRSLAHRLVGTAGTVREEALVDASRELEEVAGDAFSDDYAVGVRAREVVGAVRATVSAMQLESPTSFEGSKAATRTLPVVVAIEDNAANVALFRRIFDRIDGVELVTAQSGREGARVAVERSASLVLLDMNLPDVAGEWVLEALQGEDGKPVTRVVVVSADASPDHEELARNLGASDYVSKPFDVARLRSLVQEACTEPRPLVTPAT
jgi:CheY-like chemotaxis protein/HPt (histidine-containing phosphotransfer) domain-containing protein